MDASVHPPPGRLLLTGASGLVGRALAIRWRALGGEVVELAHQPRPNALTWHPQHGELPPPALENIHAVIHLAGATVGQRWTSSAKKAIHDSRVLSTRLLAERLAALPVAQRPRVFVCASAIGYYGYERQEPVDETAAPGEGFLADVCCAWEAAAKPAEAAGLRTVHARFGVVLARQGGALEQLLKVFNLGMAGPAGSGAQRVSWVSLPDAVEALLLLVHRAELSGPVNVVSPHVCTNRELTEAVGRILNKTLKSAAPAFALKLMFGEMAAETMLADLAVRPRRLQEAGFAWRHAALEDALRHELLA
ncbi:MAG TPA: TIGR01777 family oxidoreductase [Opitutales bacterium]|nr:TIGR01777 family oxidoreductase [Opitutales bacterium]